MGILEVYESLDELVAKREAERDDEWDNPEISEADARSVVEEYGFEVQRLTYEWAEERIGQEWLRVQQWAAGFGSIGLVMDSFAFPVLGYPVFTPLSAIAGSVKPLKELYKNSADYIDVRDCVEKVVNNSGLGPEIDASHYPGTNLPKSVISDTVRAVSSDYF